VIASPDAVIDPRAMVIESLNALIANGTMPGSGASYDFASGA